MYTQWVSGGAPGGVGGDKMEMGDADNGTDPTLSTNRYMFKHGDAWGTKWVLIGLQGPGLRLLQGSEVGLNLP